MPTHVLVNSLGLTHKGTPGVSMATLPDVCKTPSPGGPVPIPYPNVAKASDLSNGTTTVSVKGNMVAIKGSEYSMSVGDEPGTAGGVKSSTFKKETGWITYSFDVKMDGQNVCRHTDKKFHNHQNTVDLAGNVDPAPPAPTLYPEQTCPDEQRKQIHDEKEEICNKIPGGSMSPSKVSPKKLAKVPCSTIKARIEAQKKCQAKREQMRDECFNKAPDPSQPWYDEAMERKRVHDEQLADVVKGLQRSRDLESVNCAPGHPMAKL